MDDCSWDRGTEVSGWIVEKDAEVLEGEKKWEGACLGVSVQKQKEGGLRVNQPITRAVGFGCNAKVVHSQHMFIVLAIL